MAVRQTPRRRNNKRTTSWYRIAQNLRRVTGVVLLAGCLLLVVSCFPAVVWAQATLENPAPGSFQSGLGLISGWACDAQTIEIRFNGGPPQEAAYGTSRGDTQAACGDTDNGFGLLYNWNLLGDGVHTVSALADGEEFAEVTVSVTSLGAEFLTGVSSTVSVPDFPTSGQALTLIWQQAQQNFILSTGSPQGGGTSGAAPHVLENPAPGSFQSGLGLISGWVCDAQTITVRFNGGPPQEAAYGTSRGDTQAACGDTDNGFGLLYNWNLLGDGTHTVTASADGVEFANVTVTVTTLGEEFRRGLDREVTIPDFPEVGTDVVLAWQEAQQNFALRFAAPTLRLVDVTPTLSLPAGVNIPNVAITSLHSDDAPMVRAGPSPSLLLAEDAGGTVLLGLANQDGGFLGETSGEVGVSIDSTAVVLVALAAGYRLPDVDRSVVEQIQAHPQWSALTADLSRLLAADPNVLDRLAEHSAVLARIHEIAASFDGPTPAPAFHASLGPAQAQATDAQERPVMQTASLHTNFYSESPWAAHPDGWEWHGEAYPVRESPPFLAEGYDPPAADYALSATAAANPNFVHYALEISRGGSLDWYWVPGFVSLTDKVQSSYAAFRTVQLGSVHTHRISFVRYRTDTSTPRAAAMSFLNTVNVMLAAAGLIVDLKGVQKALKDLPVKDIYRDLAVCATDLLPGIRPPQAGAGGTVRKLIAFLKDHGKETLQTVAECTQLRPYLPAGWWDKIRKRIRAFAAKQLAKAGVPVGGWLWAVIDSTVYAAKAGNSALPTFRSYMSAAADTVTYYPVIEDDFSSLKVCSVFNHDPAVLSRIAKRAKEGGVKVVRKGERGLSVSLTWEKPPEKWAGYFGMSMFVSWRADDPTDGVVYDGGSDEGKDPPLGVPIDLDACQSLISIDLIQLWPYVYPPLGGGYGEAGKEECAPDSAWLPAGSVRAGGGYTIDRASTCPEPEEEEDGEAPYCLVGFTDDFDDGSRECYSAHHRLCDLVFAPDADCAAVVRQLNACALPVHRLIATFDSEEDCERAASGQ